MGLRIMRRLPGVLLIGLLLAWLGLQQGWFPWQWEVQPPAERDPYQPVALDPDVAASLTVLDYQWPFTDPMRYADRFHGERGTRWEERLQQAVAVFQATYPNVDVNVEVRPLTGPSLTEDPGYGADADVIAVWWGKPWPEPDRLVPVDPYLGEAEQAEYHPVAWELVRHGGSTWGWPRWVAFHYWFAPVAAEPEEGLWSGITAEGWNLAQLMTMLEEPGSETGMPATAVLAPPAGTGVLGEAWFDGVLPEADPPDVLQVLAPWLAGTNVPMEVAGRFIQREFLLAAGLGPAFGHWAVSPPLSDRQAVPADELALLPPPVAGKETTRVPVTSAGAYAVLRRDGPEEKVRAQLAMKLARHLSAWEPEASVSRLLAMPAYRQAITRWREGADLPASLKRRLADDIAYAGSHGIRPYGYWPAAGARMDPVTAGELWERWLTEEVSAGEVWRGAGRWHPGADGRRAE